MEDKQIEAVKCIKAAIANCLVKEARDWIFNECLMTIDWLEEELRKET